MEMWNFRGNLKERQTFNWLGGGDEKSPLQSLTESCVIESDRIMSYRIQSLAV